MFLLVTYFTNNYLIMTNNNNKIMTFSHMGLTQGKWSAQNAIPEEKEMKHQSGNW